MNYNILHSVVVQYVYGELWYLTSTRTIAQTFITLMLDEVRYCLLFCFDEVNYYYVSRSRYKGPDFFVGR